MFNNLGSVYNQWWIFLCLFAASFVCTATIELANKGHKDVGMLMIARERGNFITHKAGKWRGLLVSIIKRCLFKKHWGIIITVRCMTNARTFTVGVGGFPKTNIGCSLSVGGGTFQCELPIADLKIRQIHWDLISRWNSSMQRWFPNNLEVQERHSYSCSCQTMSPSIYQQLDVGQLSWDNRGTFFVFWASNH